MRLSLALVALFALVQADVQFTSPAAGDSISGTTIDVQWTDSGAAPAISDLSSYQLFLCAGGNDPSTITVLSTLTTTGEFSQGNSFSGTFQPTLGGTTTNAYFLKMISTATAGGDVINYSSRFSLPDMTGTFPDAVTSALESVSGTAGPASQNQVAAAAANSGNAAAAGGDFAVPYTMQTGPTRYAPMAKIPGSAITANNPTPQYPVSSWTAWQHVSGPPNAAITLTQPNPTTVSSAEPTFAAAPMPSDSDMQKFLNRWKD